MLLTKTVKVKWSGKTRKHYEEKGYVFTNYKNEFEVSVEDLPCKSTAYINVKCDCPDCKYPYLNPMKWQTYKRYVKEDGKYYCNKCATKLYGNDKYKKSRLKNSISFEQWCLNNNRQDILNRWDYELNNCQPSEVGYCSMGFNKKGYWFKCPRGIHESELKSIAHFTRGQEGSIRCNQCNSFAQWGIDNLCEDFLEKYWDYGKNIGIDPFEISYACHKKVFIRCQEKYYHESYDTSCSNFSNLGNRCPCCNGKKIHTLDSLGQYIIDNFGEEFLNNIWSDKNNKTPFEYFPKSNKKAWFKCVDEKHDDYYRLIESSKSYDFRCPDCVRERDESILQEKVRLYIESLNIGKILHENKCTIIPQNPKHKGSRGQMPFDNEMFELKLIIEVHGIQHYEVTGFNIREANKNKTTPEYELHMQQVRDRYKRIYAKMKGYNYLEIPYWTDSSDNEWKQLIDNKIQEILKLSA